MKSIGVFRGSPPKRVFRAGPKWLWLLSPQKVMPVRRGQAPKIAIFTKRQCDPPIQTPDKHQPNIKVSTSKARNLGHCKAMLSPRLRSHAQHPDGATTGLKKERAPSGGTGVRASGGSEPFEENHNASLMWQTFLRRLRPGVFASQNQKDLVPRPPNLFTLGMLRCRTGLRCYCHG